MRARWLRRGLLIVFTTAISLGLAIAGLEALASLADVPSWPARALRSTPPGNVKAVDYSELEDKPWVFDAHNSWGMRDRERSISRPPGSTVRNVLIGDSYLEFALTTKWVPAEVERRFLREGQKGVEVINLGIAGTGPRSYYYRLRDVGLALSPDAIAVFFFSGNDFLYDGEGYGQRWLPPLIDESPGGSVVGNLAPRANWLMVNRLRLSEVLAGNKPVPNEFDTLTQIVRGPPAERTPKLAAHLKQYYFPNLPLERITSVIGRDNGEFWRPFGRRQLDEEFLEGWLPNLVVLAETSSNDFYDPKSKAEAERLVKDGDIAATLSWLTAMDRAARAKGVPLVLFVIPPAMADPDYAEHWKAWPRFFSWNLVSDLRHDKLVAALRKTQMRFVDFREDLAGVRGAYRLTDAHWTEKGVEIAADRVYRELKKLEKR